MSECPICENSSVEEIDAALSTGEMTISDVADLFGISNAKVLKHFNEHMEEDGDKVPPSYTDILNELLKRLYKRVQGLLNRPVGKGTEERDISSHVKSIRELIKDIKRLKGELESSSTIKIEEANINFNQWNSFLLQNLCPECKKKYAEFLEEQEAAPVGR